MLAAQSQTVSYAFKDSDKNLEINALKNNQVLTYHGETPKLASLLKTYLSKQLAVQEKQILEGEIALG